VPLRIAFDLDGVLADMDGELLRQAEQLFGAAAVRRAQKDGDVHAEENAKAGGENTTDAGGTPEVSSGLSKGQLTARQVRRLWQHVHTIDNFWNSLEELEPGVIAQLNRIAVARRWEIVFLTRRPESAGETAQRQTQRWLESKGFDLPSVFVVQGSRGRIAAALDLDFVVDDLPGNCLDVVVDSKARAILVWRDTGKPLPAVAKRLGIGVVESVEECLNILTQVDAPAAARPRVVDRLKQMLGFNEGQKA